jgi:hypothetical protein
LVLEKVEREVKSEVVQQLQKVKRVSRGVEKDL